MADDLRQRYTEALAATCRLHEVTGSCNRCERRLEAVMAVRDEELKQLRLIASVNHGLHRSAGEEADTWRERAEKAERRNAHARALHSPNASNPLGPWCDTCMAVWPCATYAALDGQEADRG